MELCACCCCYKKHSNKCRITCLFVTALFLLIFGGVFMVMYRAIFYAILDQQTELREGTIVYPNWVHPTGDIVYVGFYFMNITNPEEFASQTPEKFVKPILEQKGPYIYKAAIVKDNIKPLDTNPKEIEYRQTFNFFYDPANTVASEDDVITTIHYVALALGPAMDWVFSQPEAASLPPATKFGAFASMNEAIRRTNTTLLMKATVRELVFGMQDPLVTVLVDSFTTVLTELGLTDLLPLPDTFGLFRRLNDSRGWHTYQSYTGDPEYWLTNKFTTVDGKKKLDYWFADTCNTINGSDGTLRPPMGTRREVLYHFYPSACRATYVTYVKDTTVKRIPAWQYRPPPGMFKAPRNSSDNECFCAEDDSELYCEYDGALYLGQCYYGAPMMLSAPHFLHGDERYLSKVVGLNPNQEEHSTVFNYEPNTGAALSVDKRLQFNLYVRPHEFIEISQKIGERFAFPIMWVNGTYMVSDENADLIYACMVVAEIAMYCLQAVLLGLGASLLGYVSYYYFYVYLSERREAFVDEDVRIEKEESGKKRNHNALVSERTTKL